MTGLSANSERQLGTPLSAIVYSKANDGQIVTVKNPDGQMEKRLDVKLRTVEGRTFFDVDYKDYLNGEVDAYLQRTVVADLLIDTSWLVTSADGKKVFLLECTVAKDEAPRASHEPVERTQTKSTPVLSIEINRSHVEGRGQSAISHGTSPKGVVMSCQATPLAMILNFVLDPGPGRLRFMDADVAEELYDVTYRCRGQGKRPADFQPLAKAIAPALALGIVMRTEEHEVWVIKSNGARLPPGEGHEAVFTHSGKHIMRNVPFSEFVKSIEASYKVFIADETGFGGAYDLRHPVKGDFADLRRYLKKEYGLHFTKERRPISIVNVRRQAPALPPNP